MKHRLELMDFHNWREFSNLCTEVILTGNIHACIIRMALQLSLSTYITK